MDRNQLVGAPRVPEVPYVYCEFPRLLYKAGAPRPHTVKSKEEEEKYTAQGWGREQVEAMTPFMPQTESEILLDRQARAHQTTVDAIHERHAEAMRVLRAEHDALREKHAKLEQAHGEYTVTHREAIKKAADLESLQVSLTADARSAKDIAEGALKRAAEAGEKHDAIAAELKPARERIEALTRHVADLTAELEETRKRLAAARGAGQVANKGKE